MKRISEDPAELFARAEAAAAIASLIKSTAAEIELLARMHRDLADLALPIGRVTQRRALKGRHPELTKALAKLDRFLSTSPAVREREHQKRIERNREFARREREERKAERQRQMKKYSKQLAAMNAKANAPDRVDPSDAEALRGVIAACGKRLREIAPAQNVVRLVPRSSGEPDDQPPAA